MGQFSWLDCKTGEQVLDDVFRDVYVLIPRRFGGGRIVEHCYNGYGEFGGLDIYELVATWNKGMIPEILRRADAGAWEYDIDEAERAALMEFYDTRDPEDWYEESYTAMYDGELRDIGIIMACYDRDNASLEYPIKITHDAGAIYESCGPSDRDPNQGWL